VAKKQPAEKKTRTKTHSPTKVEIAEMVVWSKLGYTPFAIGRMMERSHNTVKKHLLRAEEGTDKEVAQLVRHIRDKELNELVLLGAKARVRLNELLEEGKTKAIETCAIMDRTFQQRRLLEGLSTANIAYHEIDGEIEDLRQRKAQLMAELGMSNEG
jgi:DNA-binding CsgD family transcriptional regulator